MGKVAQTKFLRSLTATFVDFVFTLSFIAFMLLAYISTMAYVDYCPVNNSKLDSLKCVDSPSGLKYFYRIAKKVMMTATTKQPSIASRKSDPMCACMCCCKPAIERTDVYVT